MSIQNLIQILINSGVDPNEAKKEAKMLLEHFCNYTEKDKLLGQKLSNDDIKVLVHPQSIVHSMVEYGDGSVLAHLGKADMRIPIQYALTWPERTEGPATALDLFSCPPLTFTRPDTDTFRCLALALECARKGGSSTAVLNGANEAAVDLFLHDQISFLDIAKFVETALERVPFVQSPSLDDILAADQAARAVVHELMR